MEISAREIVWICSCSEMELLSLRYLNPFRRLMQSSFIPVYGHCNLLIYLKSSLQSCSSVWISTRAYFGLGEKSMTCTKLLLNWVCYFESWQKRLKMSMKLDVGEGERKGCDSWLRSELMPYSKGARYARCTCMFWSLWTSSPSKTSRVWFVCRVCRKPFPCRENWRKSRWNKQMGQGKVRTRESFLERCNVFLPCLERLWNLRSVGCDEVLRLPQGKADILALHCVTELLFMWKPVSVLVCTATLESGWLCKHCSAQLIILLYLYMFVRLLYLNWTLESNFMVCSLSDKFQCRFSMFCGKNEVFSCQMTLVLFSCL